MKTIVDETLRIEARRFRFLYRCDDCAHFDARAQACAHRFPTAAHRVTLEASELYFCKEFDAGP